DEVGAPRRRPGAQTDARFQGVAVAGDLDLVAVTDSEPLRLRGIDHQLLTRAQELERGRVLDVARGPQASDRFEAKPAAGGLRRRGRIARRGEAKLAEHLPGCLDRLTALLPANALAADLVEREAAV